MNVELLKAFSTTQIASWQRHVNERISIKSEYNEWNVLTWKYRKAIYIRYRVLDGVFPYTPRVQAHCSRFVCVLYKYRASLSLHKCENYCVDGNEWNECERTVDIVDTGFGYTSNVIHTIHSQEIEIKVSSPLPIAVCRLYFTPSKLSIILRCLTSMHLSLYNDRTHVCEQQKNHLRSINRLEGLTNTK